MKWRPYGARPVVLSSFAVWMSMRRWTVSAVLVKLLLAFESFGVVTRMMSVIVEPSAADGSTFSTRVKVGLVAPAVVMLVVVQVTAPPVEAGCGAPGAGPPRGVVGGGGGLVAGVGVVGAGEAAPGDGAVC